MKKLFQKIKDKYLSYARTHSFVCDACGKELFFYPMERLCVECETALYKNDGNVCKKCGRKTVTEGVCLTCKTKTPAFTAGVSPFVYRGSTASLVNRMKNGNRRLPMYFGERIADYFLARYKGLKEEFAIDRYETNEIEPLYMIPVPLTQERLRERGYNQAEELSYNVERRLQEQGVAAQTCVDVLERKGNDDVQKHLDFKEREDHAKAVYHLHKRAFCKGKTLLLIDDILTTGATASACAQLLLNAGAKAVYVLTAAAVPERENAMYTTEVDLSKF
jgi:ComF family protein